MAKPTFNEQFLQDIVNEASFKNLLVGKKLPEEMQTELFAMVRVYNEILDGFVRNRFDIEIFRKFTALDPNGGSTPENPATHSQKYQNAKSQMELRRISLSVIRGQIANMVNKFDDESKNS